ncbi:hypothetical protein [Amycolatopsis sp. NPDC004079]|uniref:hypothetical protein n=1 Tax=Amycolatopsis sp. NPDC004079 TaxID=3154549 RepID=UPI0033BB78D0
MRTQPGVAAFFTADWACRVCAAVDAGPGPEDRCRAVPSYWEWIDRARAGFRARWAFGVRDDEGRGFLLLHWDAGRCVRGEIVDREAAEQAEYLITATAQGWRELFAGYPPARAVMYRMLLLERGCVLGFFRVLYLFVESMACLLTVPTAFEPAA